MKIKLDLNKTKFTDEEIDEIWVLASYSQIAEKTEEEDYDYDDDEKKPTKKEQSDMDEVMNEIKLRYDKYTKEEITKIISLRKSTALIKGD